MQSQLRRCMQSTSRSIIQAQHRAMSFKVRVGGVEAPKIPIAERQRVQQTWGVSGNETLEKLRVATPGLTYVSVAPPKFFDEVAQAQGSSSDQLVAVARVSSDSHGLLNRMDVLGRGSNHLLIGFDPRPHRGWPVEKADPGKHLLTEIFVRDASELRSLGTFGGGSLVADSNGQGSVLVNDRPYGKLKLAAVLGSRMFVTHQGLHVGKLSLFTGRGGQLYLSTPEIIAKDRIRAASSGRWGESSITVQTSKLATPSLGVAVAGSGKVRFASVSNEDDCKCEKQTLAIAGSGSIDTGDIASPNARVAILGSGSATLQSSEYLTVGTIGAARVNYLEPGPENVRGSFSSLRALTSAAKVQHDNERAAIAAAVMPPTRESAFEDTGYTLNHWWWASWSGWDSHGFHRRTLKHDKRWRDDYA